MPDVPLECGDRVRIEAPCDRSSHDRLGVVRRTDDYTVGVLLDGADAPKLFGRSAVRRAEAEASDA